IKVNTLFRKKHPKTAKILIYFSVLEVQKVEKWKMYMEIHQLLNQGFNKTQVAKKLNISRTTVYRYLEKDPESMAKWVNSTKVRRKILDPYKEIILNWLRTHPDMSAAQVFDWLLDKYEHLKVAESTVRSYVRELRKTYDIPKETLPRDYEAVPEAPLGAQMQVDFGETTQQTNDHRKAKLYCISFVLSHSRYKYFEWLDRPFTTSDLIQAHENAFQYYGGIADEIVYDQDALILVSENGGDLFVMHKSGKLELQQCKASSGVDSSWSYSTMKANGILDNWKHHLNRDPNIYVSLVSPLNYSNLEHLLQRVRNTSSNPLLFYKNQIQGSDKKFINFAKNICDALGFDISSKDEVESEKLLHSLSRIHYRQSPDTEKYELILEKISLLFQGDKYKVYDALVRWIIDGDIWGQEININRIHAFLNDKKIRLKDIAKDERVYPRIQNLNTIYKDDFAPLMTGIIPRNEVESCINEIKAVNSVVIHGQAGSGKSGITNLVIKECEDNNIPCVAIKLDKYIPINNIEHWSNNMGLPYSIIHCIDSIAKNK